MKQVIYTPASGDSRTVDVFGMSFRAGEATPVDDAVFAKLSGNPTFRAEGAEEPAKIDGRTKAGRAAKADEEAKARATEHEADIEDAKSEAGRQG